MYNQSDKVATQVAQQAELAQAILKDGLKALQIPSDPLPPLEVLPTAARHLIEEAESALGINPAYSLAGMIFATAAAVGATHQAEIKPGSLHSACLYVVMIGLPNSNKSGGLSFTLKPIQRKDGELYEEWRGKMSDFKRATKAGQMADKPICKKTLLGDYSREAIGPIHQDNPRGIAINRDELSGWIEDFNRYSGGGEKSFWLENWSGKPISIDRVTKDPIRIPNPVISVAGTIQPEPLKRLLGGEQDGFSDRFLFAWPEIEGKALWLLDREIPLGLRDQYGAAIERLQILDFDTIDEELGEGWKPKNTPFKVPLSDAAKVTLFEFFNLRNKLFCDHAETAKLKSMHGKFDFLTIRLALVLQMLWYGYQEAGKGAISENTVKRAILLAEWFRAQSMKVYRYVHERGPLEDLDDQEQQFYRKLPQTFTTAEAKALAINKSKWSERRAERFLSHCRKLDLLTREGRGTYSKNY